MTEFSWQTRSETLSQLAQEETDVLIIGGGITGAGLALDAAVRGLKTALVEKRDFSAGTSSRSTKLIHGGLRYLEHFDFALVREGLRERALLMKIAPHQAESFPFVIPIYQQSNRNYDHPLKMRAGLILYDLLAGRYAIGRHRRINRDEALKLAPQLDPHGLKGAYVYYDGRTDDSRLVIEVIKSAATRGALIANYTRVVSFIKNGDGKVCGATLRDELTGSEFTTKAKQVINATGVWMEETLAMSNGNATQAAKTVRPSKGIHLTVSADRLKVTTAWLIPALTGHRFYFVVPWGGRVNIGTTDTDYSGDRDAPRAEMDEVNEILGAINSYFPEAQLEPSDVISAWAGLRPLISDPMVKSTTAVSRKEELFESADGVISLAGGKLTTYRLMAERGIDLAARRLQERFGIHANRERTSEVIINGGEVRHTELEATAQHLAHKENLPLDTTRHLLTAYGTEAQTVCKLARDDESLRARLIEGLPHIAAEIIYATRNEMAVTVTDVLTRRTRLVMIAGEQAVNCASRVSALMARECGWSEVKQQQEVADFTSEFVREYASPDTLRDSTTPPLS